MSMPFYNLYLRLIWRFQGVLGLSHRNFWGMKRAHFANILESKRVLKRNFGLLGGLILLLDVSPYGPTKPV